MYVYYCYAIMTTSMKNRSDREIIWALAELTKDFKIHLINLGFHFKDDEASTALKIQWQPWTSSTGWFTQVITGQTFNIVVW